MRRHWVGTLALLLGLSAMALVALPSAVYGKDATRPEAAPPAGTGGGIKGTGEVTVSSKRFSFSFGRKRDADRPATTPAATAPATPAAETAPPPKATPADTIRDCRVAGMACAIAGLGVTPFGWMRRRQRTLAGTAALLCCAALAWQYVLVGVAVGVAVAILFVILAHVG
ncbi:MAG TPA: hypothetical protein VF796_11700 [Humisphaera sp.]